MNEKLIHFIWQHQYFNVKKLFTTDNELLQIHKPGNYNTNEGPDFLNAQIYLNNICWVGPIEIHIFASDWLKHNHQKDKNYDMVILHVIWEEDTIIKDKYGNNIPTLILKPLVSPILLQKYVDLMNKNKSIIPCHNLFFKFEIIKWVSWKERLLVERLERKSSIILDKLKLNNTDWEKTTWTLIAQQLAGPLNSLVFEQILDNVPFSIFQKNKNNIQIIEAILFGQSNLLTPDLTDEYPKKLWKDYNFYTKKYNLKKQHSHVKFMRMRPASFPTIRLSQLARLICTQDTIFSLIKECPSYQNLKEIFNIETTEYWHTHYVFDNVQKKTPSFIGEDVINRIIINAVSPILFAIGVYYNDNDFKEKSIYMLEKIFPENNSITRKWTKDKVNMDTAWDSQAIIELNNQYCINRKCLSCAVGVEILKKTP